MSRSGGIWRFAALAAVGGIGAGQDWTAQPAPVPGFIGAKACGDCHSAISHRWTSGRHSKMAQPATASSVKGDFSRGEITLRGVRYRLIAAAGRYAIRERTSASDVEHRVDLTLGNRRIQHYLSKQDDGRIVVLAPTWDVERREWFHNMEIVRPDEKTVNGVQVWNKNCDGCHVSQQQKNFDPATGAYATTWQDFGTSCERCHGPGDAHAVRPSAAGGIVNPSKLDPLHATSICAQCHSLRDVVAPGYTAGANYYDHFMPLLEYGPRYEADPAWWADGRPRRFSNDALGFWESQCFTKGGATCMTCHSDPHEPDVDKNQALKPANDALCTKCHVEIGKDAAAHTHHQTQSAGSSCVECHMPPRLAFPTTGFPATMRDHRIAIYRK
jgi:predicted CXXCH cytochrome family protein